MKTSSILLGMASALVFASSASAQTVINITGATSFRKAAVQAIKASFSSLTDIAQNNANSLLAEESAGKSVFRGTFSGITGTTVISAVWNGSVEGIAVLVNERTEGFMTDANFSAGVVVSSSPNTRYVATPTTTTTIAPFAFSDVFATSSPYDTSSLVSEPVGIVPFFALINKGAPAQYTSISSEKLGQLFNSGFKKASYLFPPTGTPADGDVNVYATGRADSSGTRTTYLASSRGPTESTSGDIATVVRQWKAKTIVSSAITELQPFQLADDSHVWNPATVGNGGDSAANIATALKATSSSVKLLTAAGDTISENTPIHLISVLGLTDARTAVDSGTGARVLAWNGVPIDIGTGDVPLANSEIAKIANGSYTLWCYEQLIHPASLTADQTAFLDKLKSELPSKLGAAGIPTSTLTVSRVNDGAYVTGGE